MYRQAYPWQAARQQHADGHLVADGEGLAFLCFSCSITGAHHCSCTRFNLHSTSRRRAFAEIEGAIDRMCGVGQVSSHSDTTPPSRPSQLPPISWLFVE